MDIEWTDYFTYRAALRGFDLAEIEKIISFSSERYFDVDTGRSIIIGQHDNRLVMIPYEKS